MVIRGAIRRRTSDRPSLSAAVWLLSVIAVAALYVGSYFRCADLAFRPDGGVIWSLLLTEGCTVWSRSECQDPAVPRKWSGVRASLGGPCSATPPDGAGLYLWLETMQPVSHGSFPFRYRTHFSRLGFCWTTTYLDIDGGPRTADCDAIAVPLWAFAVLCAPVAIRRLAARTRIYRRRRRGECEYCGYDLRASSGKCPECGMKPT